MVLPVPVLVDARSLQVVGLRTHVLEFALNVIVERSHEDTADARIRGIVAGILASGIHIESLKARIVAAENLLVVAQQLLAEASGRDAQFGLLDVLHAE